MAWLFSADPEEPMAAIRCIPASFPLRPLIDGEQSGLHGKLVCITFSFSNSHNKMAPTSAVPSTIQQIARLCSPAIQYPDAALKQRIALVHPLPQAAGLLIAFNMSVIGIGNDATVPMLERVCGN